MGVKNAAATFNRKISINRCHSMVTKGNRNKTITLNPCVIHKIFFLSRSSEITPANGEKIIYAETRNVSADASMAADRAALSSYDSSARPSQVNASPNRLAVCEIKSFPNVLFFSIRKGALITLLNIFKVVFIICEYKVISYYTIPNDIGKFRYIVSKLGKCCFTVFFIDTNIRKSI